MEFKKKQQTSRLGSTARVFAQLLQSSQGRQDVAVVVPERYRQLQEAIEVHFFYTVKEDENGSPNGK